MAGTQAYDPDLQMFKEEPKPINLNRLTFERWLVDHDQSEHDVAGPSSGQLVPSEEEASHDDAR